MFGFERDTESSTDIKPRLRRALEQPLSVVSTDGTPVCGNASIVSVESHTGNSYTVDVREGRCDCRDARYNLDDDQRCKHQIRAEMALGRSPVPVRAAEAVDVDGTLGAHTDASLQFVAADGGVIDGDTGELLEDEPDREPDSEPEDEVAWSDPRPEIDKHGVPTGAHVVECAECGIETITALTDHASHREGCSHSM